MRELCSQYAIPEVGCSGMKYHFDPSLSVLTRFIAGQEIPKAIFVLCCDTAALHSGSVSCSNAYYFMRVKFLIYPFNDRIKEAAYALDKLNAVGVVLLSNHEGKYLGNPLFKAFFAYLNSRATKHEVIFIHPNNPTLDLNGTFVPADPSNAHCYLLMLPWPPRGNYLVSLLTISPNSNLCTWTSGVLFRDCTHSHGSHHLANFSQLHQSSMAYPTSGRFLPIYRR